MSITVIGKLTVDVRPVAAGRRCRGGRARRCGSRRSAACSAPIRPFSSVDLPAPFGPTTAVSDPSANCSIQVMDGRMAIVAEREVGERGSPRGGDGRGDAVLSRYRPQNGEPKNGGRRSRAGETGRKAEPERRRRASELPRFPLAGASTAGPASPRGSSIARDGASAESAGADEFDRRCARGENLRPRTSHRRTGAGAGHAISSTRPHASQMAKQTSSV